MRTLKIGTIEIAGFGGALHALRLPFGKEVRSITNLSFKIEACDDLVRPIAIDGGEYNYGQNIILDIRDLQLASTLVKRGDEHAKVLRGIMVWAKIDCPIYFARELETYRCGRERLSCTSTMHQECKGMSGKELQMAKGRLPMGTPCTFVDVFSYQTLRRIVHQRKGHRLPEWRQFIGWVKTLPLADDLIFCGMEE
mgnify:CR=1 FL=1